MTVLPESTLAPDRRLSRDEALTLANLADLSGLLRAAAARRDAAHGAVVTYSRKVFVPLTKLCRDVCHYCTFARRAAERRAGLSDARRGPRHRADRSSGRTARRRCSRSATSRNCAIAWRERSLPARTRDDPVVSRRGGGLVMAETGLLPHVNPGLLTPATSRRCARFPFRRGSCSKARRSGCASAADLITGRPTRRRRRASRRSGSRVKRACRSRAAS